MTQPAATAQGKIESLLARIIEHEVKIVMAEAVDARYGTSFQASRDHWRKEIRGFWQKIEKANQTRLRHRGQFFSDAEIAQWKEPLRERGVRLACNRLAGELRKHGIKPDTRWLRITAEEHYD